MKRIALIAALVLLYSSLQAREIPDGFTFPKEIHCEVRESVIAFPKSGIKVNEILVGAKHHFKYLANGRYEHRAQPKDDKEPMSSKIIYEAKNLLNQDSSIVLKSGEHTQHIWLYEDYFMGSTTFGNGGGIIVEGTCEKVWGD